MISNPVAALELVATTGPNGAAFQNGTPTFLTWTAPNDGQLHRLIMFIGVNVTVAQTGGGVTATVAGSSHAVMGAGFGVGFASPGSGIAAAIIPPGQTVTLAQTAAQTAGAAAFLGEIWAL